MLTVGTYGFLFNLPHPPSTALGFADGASAVCLAIAAWRLWLPTMDE